MTTDEQMNCLEEVISNVTRHTHVRVIEVTDTTIHYRWTKSTDESPFVWVESSITKDSLLRGIKRLELEIHWVKGML